MQTHSDNQVRSDASPGRILSRSVGRRRFLGGAAAIAAGAAGAAVLGGGRAQAFELVGQVPIVVDDVQPVEAGRFLAERVAGRTALEPDLWRPGGFVWLRNQSSETVHLWAMQVSYLGAGAPEPRALLVSAAIAPGKVAAVPVQEDRLHPFPLPHSIRIECYFWGMAAPVTAQRTLIDYQNDQPGGAYYFPADWQDLPEEHYWIAGSNHGYGSNHAGSETQCYAYDLGVARWSGSNWVRTKAGTDGSKNEDWLIWGTPVYAMAAGKILKGYRNIEDNEAPGVLGSAGGNRLWIQHEGGDLDTAGIALYAHLMQDSIPPELVPVEGQPGPHVVRGQFLGLVGNSGRSTNPHLHLHLHRGMRPNKDSFSGHGRPLLFRDIRVREADGFDPTQLHAFWKVVSRGAVGEQMLIEPRWGGPPYTAPKRPPTGPGGEAAPDRNPGAPEGDRDGGREVLASPGGPAR